MIRGPRLHHNEYNQEIIIKLERLSSATTLISENQNSGACWKRKWQYADFKMCLAQNKL
jgi:hypothetical protein